jgi:hypothetical protein
VSGGGGFVWLLIHDHVDAGLTASCSIWTSLLAVAMGSVACLSVESFA